MRVVDIVQGFLGSGKTTLINNLIQEVFTGEKILIIQTEWGDIEVKEFGGRVALRNWDWEKGFNLMDIRKLLRSPGVDRIIIEWNGMAPVGNLLHTLEIMETRGEIKLGHCLAVFHGPTWEVMRRPLEEIFCSMALNSQGFWVREGNQELHQWLKNMKSDAFITMGDNLASWYKDISKVNQPDTAKELLRFSSVVIVMYLLYWLIFKGLR